jgi:hypothetical protein
MPKIKPTAAIVIIAFLGLGFGWWGAHREKDKARNTLHAVCEAARRSNEELLGHPAYSDLQRPVATGDEIVPELRRIFAAGCGSPIPTE